MKQAIHPSVHPVYATLAQLLDGRMQSCLTLGTESWTHPLTSWRSCDQSQETPVGEETQVRRDRACYHGYSPHKQRQNSPMFDFRNVKSDTISGS